MSNDTTTRFDATKGRGHAQPATTAPLHAAHDAPAAPMPTGLSQAELRRIVLDLIG